MNSVRLLPFAGRATGAVAPKGSAFIIHANVYFCCSGRLQSNGIAMTGPGYKRTLWEVHWSVRSSPETGHRREVSKPIHD